MKSIYFVAYLIMACAFLVEAAKNIQIYFPSFDNGLVMVNGDESLMICHTHEEKEDNGAVYALIYDGDYEDCVYNVKNNNVVCRYIYKDYGVTKYMKVTFTIKNKPTCTLTNKSKFTEVKSFDKKGKKYVESPYTLYFTLDGNKFREVSFKTRRFTITVNSGCTFNADISKYTLGIVKKSNF